MLRKLCLIALLCLIPSLVFALSGEEALTRSYDIDTQSLKVKMSSSTAVVAINDGGSTLEVADERYEGKSATGVAGIATSTGAIAGTTFNVDKCSFYVTGGDASVSLSWQSGTVSIVDGSAFNLELNIAEASPTITVESLGAGASVYYSIDGNN